MGTKFIPHCLNGLQRRAMLTAMIVYWIALSAGAVVLMFAGRHDERDSARVPRPPYLVSITPQVSPITTRGAPAAKRTLPWANC
jgi:hypothetical protein